MVLCVNRGPAWTNGRITMPIATGVGNATKRVDLQSCPGGFVVIRRMTYGEKMVRKSFLSKVKIGSETGNRAERRSKSAQAFSAELDMMNEKVTEFEFNVSIVQHNLTYLVDENDPNSETPLDFKNPQHIKMLDGNIGEEIDEAITEFNDFENDENTGKS